jgi:hypothetical protein
MAFDDESESESEAEQATKKAAVKRQVHVVRTMSGVSKWHTVAHIPSP